MIATTVLAVVWPLNDLAMQKNPVGQLIANAILLLVAVPALRRLLPCLLLLVPGLFLTESRGAIIAAAIGIVVIVLMQGFRERSGIHAGGRPRGARSRRVRPRCPRPCRSG